MDCIKANGRVPHFILFAWMGAIKKSNITVKRINLEDRTHFLSFCASNDTCMWMCCVQKKKKNKIKLCANSSNDNNNNNNVKKKWWKYCRFYCNIYTNTKCISSLCHHHSSRKHTFAHPLTTIGNHAIFCPPKSRP